jgi:hypothetical protein
MNLHSASAQVNSSTEQHHTTSTRLQGRWLALFRLIWIVLSVFALVLFFVSLPEYFASQLKSYTAGYAIFLFAMGIFVAVMWFIVAALIFWRKSDDWMALLVSLMLLLQGLDTTAGPLRVSTSVWLVPALVMNFLAFALLFLVFCLFPNGRAVPRWIGWLVVLFTVLYFGALMVGFFDLLPQIFNLLFFLVIYCLLGSSVIAQFYRYHSVSSRIERLQTKWIVFGVTVTYLIEFAFALSTSLFPSFFSTGSLANVILLPLGNIIPILIPLSFGFAILHYRLYDIDIIIHRTLVYSILTVLLAMVYEVSVFTLQYLTGGFIKGNQLAIIASTFLIGALFKPVHGRTQKLIDRRFFRRKYDAARTLATFSETIRDEVDLNQLCTKLTAVVEETMQPAHVSLWLCPPKRYGEKTTRALPIIETVSEP